jgi:hypothetical protein
MTDGRPVDSLTHEAKGAGTLIQLACDLLGIIGIRSGNITFIDSDW